jgi:amidase
MKRRTFLQGSSKGSVMASVGLAGCNPLTEKPGGPAWTIDQINGDHFRGGSSSPATRAGYPSISVPASYIHGLPVGISLFPAAWREHELIAMAYAFEQARGPRQVPKLAPSLDLP